MQQSNITLYTQVVRVTHVYLGPAADRFIARQVQNHLHKEPDELSESDLLRLIDWVRIAVSLITEDRAIVEEYIERLKRLTVVGSSPDLAKEPNHAS
ncbi:MAG: hypothetical protein JWN82_88 [Candidatus Saccharibacteria bacterium]|nr:hypothetical protein [Candidatus Saccharibacteria bacterium]